MTLNPYVRVGKNTVINGESYLSAAEKENELYSFFNLSQTVFFHLFIRVIFQQC